MMASDAPAAGEAGRGRLRNVLTVLVSDSGAADGDGGGEDEDEDSGRSSCPRARRRVRDESASAAVDPTTTTLTPDGPPLSETRAPPPSRAKPPPPLHDGGGGDDDDDDNNNNKKKNKNSNNDDINDEDDDGDAGRRPLAEEQRHQRRRRDRRRCNDRRGGAAGRRGTGPPTPSERLPDILNAHLPPPYSTLPNQTERSAAVGLPPHAVVAAVPPVIPLHFVGRSHAASRRETLSPSSSGCRWSSKPRPRGSTRQPCVREDEPKSCCGMVVTQTVSIRWFIVMIAFVGLCCAVVGTILGALKATGREHLWSSLLMTGVGIVLITVSGIAWRLTSQDAPSCRMMLGFGRAENDVDSGRRYLPRISTYGRPHHPYPPMMYPEFHCRPPPPSYQASMQEYRLRLLLLDRQHPTASPSAIPIPPPFYRAQTGPRSGILTVSRESEPPSYRSRISPSNPVPSAETPVPAQEAPASDALADKKLTVVTQDIPKGSRDKDDNLVTIVQTTNMSQVIGQDSVIVTIRGSVDTQTREVDVLAQI